MTSRPSSAGTVRSTQSPSGSVSRPATERERVRLGARRRHPVPDRRARRHRLARDDVGDRDLDRRRRPRVRRRTGRHPTTCRRRARRSSRDRRSGRSRRGSTRRTTTRWPTTCGPSRWLLTCRESVPESTSGILGWPRSSNCSRPSGGSGDLRHRPAVRRPQGPGVRRRVPGRLHLRGQADALHPPRRVRRLRCLRAGLPGRGDLLRGRHPGGVEGLLQRQRRVLRRPRLARRRRQDGRDRQGPPADRRAAAAGTRSTEPARPAASPRRLPDFPWDHADAVRRARARRTPTASSTCRSARRSTRRPRSSRRRCAAAADAPGYPHDDRPPETRQACVDWLARRLGVDRPRPRRRAAGRSAPRSWSPRCRRSSASAPATWSCYPELAYPTYEVGAALAGAARGRDRLADRARPAQTPALVWLNSPSNPTGRVLPRRAPAQGRRLVPRARRAAGLRRVLPRVRLGGRRRSRCCTPTVSGGSPRRASSPCTRCRSGPTWPATAARSSPATRRVVGELLAVRKNLGLMMPGPQQAAMVAALDDDEHVVEQRARYAARRATLRDGARAARASGSTTPRRRSTSGPPATRTAGTPSPGSPSAASWSPRATSTAPPARGTCGWPSPPPTSGSTPPSTRGSPDTSARLEPAQSARRRRRGRGRGARGSARSPAAARRPGRSRASRPRSCAPGGPDPGRRR